MATELSQVRQQLAERSLERDRAVSALEPFLEARDFIAATAGAPARGRSPNRPDHLIGPPEDSGGSGEAMLLGRVATDSHSRVLERAAAREQVLKLLLGGVATSSLSEGVAAATPSLSLCSPSLLSRLRALSLSPPPTPH